MTQQTKETFNFYQTKNLENQKDFSRVTSSKNLLQGSANQSLWQNLLQEQPRLWFHIVQGQPRDNLGP